MIGMLAASTTSTGGGGLSFLILPVVIFGAMYFLMIRPQKRQRVQQQMLLNSLEVGDDVMTAGGIFGTIVERSAGILAVGIDDEGAREIAKRARGTPRVANRLLRRVRDFAEVRHDGAITGDIARMGLELFEVDEQGLDRLDIAVLRAIVERFGGGPVGLTTLAASVGEETDTVEDVVEPYLLQLGFLQRTPRGRVATEHAYRHLGATAPGTLPL